MLAFVVVSHGSFAQGVVDSSYMIFGKQDKVQTVTFQLDEEPNELADKLAAAVARFDADDQVLFLVDLWAVRHLTPLVGSLPNIQSAWV
ncbi:hypothetical protein TUA1478L_05670 [Lactiplantibacillus plantarum]